MLGCRTGGAGTCTAGVGAQPFLWRQGLDAAWACREDAPLQPCQGWGAGLGRCPKLPAVVGEYLQCWAEHQQCLGLAGAVSRRSCPGCSHSCCRIASASRPGVQRGDSAPREARLHHRSCSPRNAGAPGGVRCSPAPCPQPWVSSLVPHQTLLLPSLPSALQQGLPLAPPGVPSGPGPGAAGWARGSGCSRTPGGAQVGPWGGGDVPGLC